MVKVPKFNNLCLFFREEKGTFCGLWPPKYKSGPLDHHRSSSGLWPPKMPFFLPEKETQVVEFRHHDHCKHCQCLQWSKCRNSTTCVSFSGRKNNLLGGQRPPEDLWWSIGPLKYLRGHRQLKAPFSCRKKRHKLLNFGTLTIVNIDKTRSLLVIIFCGQRPTQT